MKRGAKMSDGKIHYESSNGIALITIDRPQKRNALTATMCGDLEQAWLRFRDSPEDRVAILCAEGDVFTAGADLTNPPQAFWKAVPEVGVQFDKPVIAALSGRVVGMGVTLLTFCDLIVATEDSEFLYPEARIGIAAGLISALSARIPSKIALELMYGVPLAARRAYDVGFVNRLVPPGQALTAAREIATELVASAPLVLALMKNLVRETLAHSPIEITYASQRKTEQVAMSADAKEGLSAFKERRRPVFKGT